MALAWSLANEVAGMPEEGFQLAAFLAPNQRSLEYWNSLPNGLANMYNMLTVGLE